MARIWIYQANRFLSNDEALSIKVDLDNFVANWTAHGSQLAGKAEIVNNLFLVLEVDEEVAGVTGCSIDKSVHFIKSLGDKYTIDFFDRMRVAYIDDKGTLQIASRDQFSALVKDNVVNSSTIVFNNLIQTSEEFDKNWKIPFAESWHSKIF